MDMALLVALRGLGVGKGWIECVVLLFRCTVEWHGLDATLRELEEIKCWHVLCVVEW